MDDARDTMRPRGTYRSSPILDQTCEPYAWWHNRVSLPIHGHTWRLLTPPKAPAPTGDLLGFRRSTSERFGRTRPPPSHSGGSRSARVIWTHDEWRRPGGGWLERIGTRSPGAPLAGIRRSAAVRAYSSFDAAISSPITTAAAIATERHFAACSEPTAAISASSARASAAKSTSGMAAISARAPWRARA